MKVLIQIVAFITLFNISVNAQSDAEFYLQTGMDLINRDKDKSGMQYVKKAVDLGFAPAFTVYGLCFEKGWGTDVDMSTAVKWYKKAADKNDPDGLFALSRCYATDNNEGGVPTDLKKSFELCKKAADKGQPYAMSALALKYYNGTGCKQNKNLGRKLAIKAKDAGCSDAKILIDAFDTAIDVLNEEIDEYKKENNDDN